MASNQINPELIAKENYDKFGEQYVAWRLSRDHPHLRYLSQLIKTLPDPKTANVLELGCGAGVPVTDKLVQSVGHVTANDISSTMVTLAKGNLAKHQNVEFVEGSMLDLDIAQDSLDAVVAFYSIIHLDQGQQREMVRKIHSWLKAGGLLLLNLPVLESSGRLVDDWLGMKAFWSSLGDKASRDMIEKSGFETVFQEASHEPGDSAFLWMIARKRGMA